MLLGAALSVAGDTYFGYCSLVSLPAKFSMVLVASVGLPSKTGSSVPFVRAMSHRWRLVVASVTAIARRLHLFGGPAAIAAIACSSIAAVFIAILATRGFGGITGDVIGASNEIGRLSFVIVYVVLS